MRFFNAQRLKRSTPADVYIPVPTSPLLQHWVASNSASSIHLSSNSILRISSPRHHLGLVMARHRHRCFAINFLPSMAEKSPARTRSQSSAAATAADLTFRGRCIPSAAGSNRPQNIAISRSGVEILGFSGISAQKSGGLGRYAQDLWHLAPPRPYE